MCKSNHLGFSVISFLNSSMLISPFSFIVANLITAPFFLLNNAMAHNLNGALIQ